MAKRSGGVNIDSDTTRIGGDVVGRDQVFQIKIDRPPDLTSSRLPPRNPLFVGRKKTLEQLAERLSADNALVILTGPGGMGKTQTAIEFGHAHAALFPGGVFWIRCDRPDLIGIEVAACGNDGRIALVGYDELPQPEKVNLVLAAWQQPVARLLIFDNAEDPASIQQWRPATGGCRVLVTARRGHWPPALTRHILELPTLDRADSLSLLAYGDDDRATAFAADTAADAIADRLGDLPLALHVAAAYLAHYNLTPAQYLAELKACASALAHESLGDWLTDALPTEHTPNVAATFELSYVALTTPTLTLPRSGTARTGEGTAAPSPVETGDPASGGLRTGRGGGLDLALQIFHLLAHCAPAVPLPRDVLMKALERATHVGADHDPPLPSASHVELTDKRLTDALRQLADVGLVTLDTRLRPIIHRLMQEYARGKAADPDADAALMEEIVGEMATEINKAGLPKAMEPLLPHLQMLAERAEARGSDIAGRLFNSVGYHLNDIAAYTAARAAYERALAIDEKAFGPDHPQVAIFVNNLGLVYQALGDLPAARAAFERALAIDEKAFGPDHPNVARDVNNLGLVYNALGDLPAARAAFERALAIDEKAFGPDHPKIAIRVNNLGEVYEAEGNLAAAREAYQRALAIMEKYAPNNPNTRIFRENLARVIEEMNQRNSESANDAADSLTR
jgi:tetratricopeptide (TPR) repeat protein